MGKVTEKENKKKQVKIMNNKKKAKDKLNYKELMKEYKDEKG
jgi:hypothetical protein